MDVATEELFPDLAPGGRRSGLAIDDVEIDQIVKGAVGAAIRKAAAIGDDGVIG